MKRTISGCRTLYRNGPFMFNISISRSEIFLQIIYFQTEQLFGILLENKYSEKKIEYRILYCTK